MKPINEMNPAELAELYDRYYGADDISTRLRELHEQHRWIPVGERLPTEADADEDGFIDCYGKYGRFPMRLYHIDNLDIGSKTFTHWRRIDKP